MMTSNKHINLKLFYSLCTEYNLSINLRTDFVIHACIPSKYVKGSFMLEYNMITDSLFMPLNIERDNKHIFLFSVAQYSPKLFKIMCKKFIKLEKELKEFENQRRIENLNEDF